MVQLHGLSGVGEAPPQGVALPPKWGETDPKGGLLDHREPV
jgi:hypothetical protein